MSMLRVRMISASQTRVHFPHSIGLRSRQSFRNLRSRQAGDRRSGRAFFPDILLPPVCLTSSIAPPRRIILLQSSRSGGF